MNPFYSTEQLLEQATCKLLLKTAWWARSRIIKAWASFTSPPTSSKFKNHIEFKATINDEFYSLENDARDTGKDWPTWVSHGDLIDFIGIEPHLALPTLENAWSEPLLQLKHNHFSPLLSYPYAVVELMMQSYLTLSTDRFLGFGGLDFQWACLFLNGLSRFGIYFLNGLGSLLMGFHGKLYLHNGLEYLLMGFHDFRKIIFS